ncbi:hypothetical protein D3C72_1367520 [compost metagenome]
MRVACASPMTTSRLWLSESAWGNQARSISATEGANFSSKLANLKPTWLRASAPCLTFMAARPSASRFWCESSTRVEAARLKVTPSRRARSATERFERVP